jgi:hypothetical protein
MKAALLAGLAILASGYLFALPATRTIADPSNAS